MCFHFGLSRGLFSAPSRIGCDCIISPHSIVDMTTTILPPPTTLLTDIMTTVQPVDMSEILVTTIWPDVVADQMTTAAGIVSPQEAVLAPLINDFSIKLCESLAKRSKGSNVFVSPFSVSTVLSILLLGARSSSRDQLKHGLEFDSIDGQNQDPLLIHSHFQQVGSFTRCRGRETDSMFTIPISLHSGANVSCCNTMD